MKQTKRIRESIGVNEYKRLMNFTRGDDEIKTFTRKRFLKIYTLLYYTGMRLNEVSQLRVSDLISIINEKEVKIITHKQKMERKLFFSEEAVKSIKKLFAEDLHLNNDAKLIRKQNNPYATLSPLNLIDTVNKHIQKAFGNKSFTSHSFRQGLISDYATKGVNIRIIQEFIGHSDTKTTLRYIRPTGKDIRKTLVR